jgi:hypothetical protein
MRVTPQLFLSALGMIFMLLAGMGCGREPTDEQRVVNAIGQFQDNRWQAYLTDSSFDYLSIEQLVYYTECEAYRLGLIRYGSPVKTKITPESVAKLELRVAKQLKSSFSLSITSTSAVSVTQFRAEVGNAQATSPNTSPVPQPSSSFDAAGRGAALKASQPSPSKAP